MNPLIAVPLAALGIAGAPAAPPEGDALYQLSTLQALQVGLYQPAMSIGQLREHGDFGLGTFEGLDGEMVVTQGTVFQVPFSGKARVARDSQQTPFAVVTFFDADQRFGVRRPVDVPDLNAAVDRRLPSLNDFYAVKVTGTFAYVQTRSVAKQPKPYLPLSAAVAGQRTFDLRNVKGTLVGIRSPQYVGALNVAGYHWHFITAAGKRGGHVLAMDASRLRVAVDQARAWHVELPATKAFWAADLG